MKEKEEESPLFYRSWLRIDQPQGCTPVGGPRYGLVVETGAILDTVPIGAATAVAIFETELRRDDRQLPSLLVGFAAGRLDIPNNRPIFASDYGAVVCERLAAMLGDEAERRMMMYPFEGPDDLVTGIETAVSKSAHAILFVCLHEDGGTIGFENMNIVGTRGGGRVSGATVH